MKTKTKFTLFKEQEYVFTKKEMKVVRHCLDYAYHRLAKHHRSGLKQVVHLEQVNNIRAQF